jgi:hypothetical protein
MLDTSHFHKLENIEVPRPPSEFCLDTLCMEEQMREKNGGWRLDKISSGTTIDEKHCRTYVPHFPGKVEIRDPKSVKTTVSRYRNIKGPCSMSVDSFEEVADHISVAYQVAFYHYALAKRYNVRAPGGGNFPTGCCGPSSRTVTLSLIEFGYPNAAVAVSSKYVHAYPVIPFIVGPKGIQGSIIIDPTFDQMWDDTKMRNAVFVKWGSTWEYQTDWSDGANLFPDRICSQDIIRKNPFMDEMVKYHKGGKRFLEKAYANPIRLKEAA